jgi:hypothetical protein
LRSRLKNALIDGADRLLGRGGTPELPLEILRPYRRPRPDPRSSNLDWPAKPRRAGSPNAPILITGRFRAGTTLLWNVFRQVPGVTAYYEPFNERRWFDPSHRGSTTDPSHRGVEEYWAEYCDLETLAPLFRTRWHDRNLFMNTDAHDDAMKSYVRALIERAPARAVLQFNRIDFRLPWFRRTFPEAMIVHIVRNPRDQWCSTLVDPACFKSDDPSDRFESHDGFYLRLWIERLRFLVPALTECYEAHPYRAYYLLWRLSQIFGLAYADVTLGFERLVEDPNATIAALFAAVGLGSAPVDVAAAVVGPRPPGHWSDYATDDWFAGHEHVAEEHLEELFE